MKVRFLPLVAAVLLLSIFFAGGPGGPVSVLAQINPTGTPQPDQFLYIPIVFADPGEGSTQPTATATLGTPTATLPVGVTPSATATATATLPPGVTPTATNTEEPTATPTQTLVPSSADLGIDVTSNTKTILAGQAFTYIFSVTNAGPDTANDVVAAVTLPAGLTFVSANPAGVYNNTTKVWTIGAMAMNDAAQLTISVKSGSGSGTYAASAVVSSQSADPVAANNSDSSTVFTVSAGTTFISDDFNYAPNVKAPWAFVNPKVEPLDPPEDGWVPDTSRAWVDGTHLNIEVMEGNGGHEPNCFGYRNCTPRLVQSVNNPQQFTVRAKFQSKDFTGTRKSQGLLMQNGNGEYFYMSLFTEGANVYVKAMEVSGSHYGPIDIVPQKNILSEVANRELLYLQITRDGSSWILEYSADGGTTWVQYATHTYTRSINTIGVFAGNGSVAAPGFTARVDYVFNMDSPIDPEDGNDASGLLSYDFGGSLPSSSLWTFTNPVGTPNILGQTATQLKMYFPTGVEHDVWDSSVNQSYGVRLMQGASDANFDVEVKFDSALAGTYTGQGLLVMKDAANFLQYYFYSYNFQGTEQLHIFASLIKAGVQQTPFILDDRIDVNHFGSPPMRLRILREGNLYRLYFSQNGASWVQAASFSDNLSVKQVGIFAGNEDDKLGGTPPGLTALVDHFQNLRAPLAVQD